MYHYVTTLVNIPYMDPMGLKGIHIFQGCVVLFTIIPTKQIPKNKLLTDHP